MKKILVFILFFVSTSLFALEIDKANSTFQWTGTKLKGQHTGKILVKSVDIKTNKNKNSKKVDVVGGKFVLDLTTITCEDLTGKYNKKLVTHLKSADFFNVNKWPTATLEISEMKAGKAKGKLTIKDKTHPVTIPYKNSGNSYSGTLKFDRTKFGMVYKSKNFFKNIGDKFISDEVKLDFKVVLK